MIFSSLVFSTRLGLYLIWLQCAKMGQWKNGWLLLGAGWTSALVITAMDIYGLPEALQAVWHMIVG